MNNDTRVTDSTLSLIDTLTNRWSSFGNCPTPRLQASWSQAFDTFDRKISEHGTPNAADWYVLNPATGTGKSEGLKVYAAGTASNSPGIMIVVRLISQADHFVADINELAGAEVAVARHSDNKASLESLKDYPVLVITHAAFTGKPQQDHELWRHYSAFGSTGRKLVVIDEALDILDIARVQADDVERILRVVPHAAWARWPEARSAIDTLLELLREIDAKATQGPQPKARLLIGETQRQGMTHFQDGWSGFEELEALRTWLLSDEHRYLLGKRRVDVEAERRQKVAHDAILRNLISVYTSFIVHSKEGKRHTFSTARSLLPDEGQGCVVMDATADTNAIYECMVTERLRVFRQPAIRCRDYGNATLKVSFGHSVGRSSLVKAGKDGMVPMQTEAPKLMASLMKEHTARAATPCPMERVLIVGHLAAEQHLQGFTVPFEYEVAHYGALDGRNDWREFDTVVIYGLDYRHPTDPGVSFIALQGDQKLDPFGDPAGRSFGGHDDIITALSRGWIVSSLVQAVNRIRTRRVIDADGNCPESFVYLALPDNALGKAVRHAVLDQMPGIKTERWNPQIRKTPSRSKHEKSLEGLVRQMVPGESYTATEVQNLLSISQSAWKRLVKKLPDDASDLGQLMSELRVAYQVTGAGRGQRATIRKL